MYEEEGTENPLKLQMVGWRGTMSLRAYVPIHDAIHYLRLLGADCSKFGMYFFFFFFLAIYIKYIFVDLKYLDLLFQKKINLKKIVFLLLPKS